MKKLLAVALILLAFILPAAAHGGSHTVQAAEEPGQQDVEQELAGLQDAVNAIDAPGFVNSLVGNQRIQLHLNTSAPENFPEDFSGQQDLSVTTEGLHISSIDTGEVDRPTFEIWAEQEDLDDIASADSTVETLQDKVENGEISYNVHGLVNRIRFGIARVLFSLFA